MAKTTKATDTAGAAVATETEQVNVSSAEAEKNEASGVNKATTTTKVTYTVAEFAKAAATVFDRPIHQDIISGAFKMAGKQEATKEEAAKLVSEFLGKEIKLK